MNLLEYFGMNQHSLPPVVEPGRTGRVLRYCHDNRIINPNPDVPVLLTMAQRNIERQAANRAEILRLIGIGVVKVREITKAACVSEATVWKHVKGLEEEGLIAIDRRVKPWAISATRKYRSMTK